MRNDILNTTAITIVGRTGGFFVPFVVAAFFGSTWETDVFFLIYGGILCLMLLMGHLFESVIVPHLAENSARGQRVDRLVGAAMTRTTLFVGLLLLIAVPTIKPILATLTQFSPESLDLAFRLFLIMAPMALLMAWTSTLIGALNAEKVFHVGALSPLFRTVVVIFFIVVFNEQWGIYSAAWGFLCGESLRLIAALHAYLKRSHRLELSWAENAVTADFFASASYQAIGFGLLSLTSFVNHLAASWLAAGSLSIFAYALQMRKVPALIFTTGLGTVVLSHWSSGHSRSSGEFTWPRIKRVFGKLFLVSGVSAVGLILCRDQLASIVLGWGAFPEDKLPLVATLFAIFIVALPFDVTSLLSVRVLIILKLDATYSLLAAFKLILLVGLNCILIPSYGLIGIGIATTTASVLHAIVLFYFVTKQRVLLSGSNSSVESKPCDASHRPRELAREMT